MCKWSVCYVSGKCVCVCVCCVWECFALSVFCVFLWFLCGLFVGCLCV